MGMIKTKIEEQLKTVGRANIDRLLNAKEWTVFIKCKSNSHHCWEGGTAQHCWEVYQYMLYLRDHPDKALQDKLGNKTALLKSISDDSIAVVGLLHDLGKGTHAFDGHHNDRSLFLIEQCGFAVSDLEAAAILFHHRPHAKHSRINDYIKLRAHALCELVRRADNISSGTAWNGELYKNGMTQHTHSQATTGYLRAIAMDRTCQCLEFHLYMDDVANPHFLKGYNRDRVEWNSDKRIASDALNNRCDGDMISLLRTKVNEGKNCLLVVGVDASVPRDANTRLRSHWKHEQDVLICSNLLNSFYRSDSNASDKKHHYGFTMRDSIKQHYRNQQSNKTIFLPEVIFFRDGESEGFRMVAPWKCDVLLVPGWKGWAIVENISFGQLYTI